MAVHRHFPLLEGKGDNLDHIQEACHASFAEVLPHKVEVEDLVLHKHVWIVGKACNKLS